MSAENSRLTRAIQRIAREDPDLRRAIGATQPRGSQPGGTGVGESDAERDRLCCDGSTSDNANPGTSTRDSEDGTAGLDADDPADLGDIGGCLTGVTDCATGTPICWCGDDWVPPEGWEDAQSPALEETYTEGMYWRTLAPRVGNYHFGPTRAGSASAAASESAAAGYVVDYGLNKCGNYVVISGTSTQADDGSAVCSAVMNGLQYMNPASAAPVQLDCSGSESDYCNPSDDEIREDAWPADGCVNLALRGGQIVGSKYDPENDGSYSAPRDEIELCDEDGSRTLIRVDTGSTWKSIKSLDGDIDPDTGYGYLYDTVSGKKIRQISRSEFRDDTV